MGRASGAGTIRKALVGLLVLVLIALSALPASIWPTPVTGQADGHAAAADCGGSHDPGAVPAPPDQEPPRGHHEHVPPGLACCVALHCPMLLADVRRAPAEPRLPVGLRLRAAVAVRQPAGLDVAPALPPPRDAA